MRRTMTQRIICIVVATLFLVNDICFGLGVMPGSTQPATKEAMYALGQKLFGAKRGPGVGGSLDKYNPGIFTGEAPQIPGVEFVKVIYNLPQGWENNPILQKTDLIEALRSFRDNAKINADFLDIKEGYFEADEKNGELPISRIEAVEEGGEVKYVLIVHTKFVQMWNHIRCNDVWFEANIPDSGKRTVSVAWGIFYRLAKHEMAELSKKDGKFKSLGHISPYSSEPERDEGLVNLISGHYGLFNDAIWMWFLGSYSFSNSTRYNNETLQRRMEWFFENADSRANNLRKEFPIQVTSNVLREEAYELARAVNYHFFSRKGVSVPELTVRQELVKEYEAREAARKAAGITEPPLYAAGPGRTPDSSAEPQERKPLVISDATITILEPSVHKGIKNAALRKELIISVLRAAMALKNNSITPEKLKGFVVQYSNQQYEKLFSRLSLGLILAAPTPIAAGFLLNGFSEGNLAHLLIGLAGMGIIAGIYFVWAKYITRTGEKVLSVELTYASEIKGKLAAYLNPADTVTTGPSADETSVTVTPAAEGKTREMNDSVSASRKAARDEALFAFDADRGVLLATSDNVPAGVTYTSLFKDQRMVVLETSANDADVFASAAIRALLDNNNQIERIIVSDASALERLAQADPDIILAPNAIEAARSLLQDYANQKGAADILYYETFDAEQEVNLSVGASEKTMQMLLRALKEHVSQVRRTDYVTVAEEMSRYAAMLAKLAGFSDNNASFADNFRVCTITRDGALVQPQTGEKYRADDFLPADSSAQPELAVFSPHPDDMEIAAKIMVRRYLERMGIVHNIIFTGGESAVKLTEEEKAAGVDPKAMRKGEARRAAAHLMSGEGTAYVSTLDLKVKGSEVKGDSLFDKSLESVKNELRPIIQRYNEKSADKPFIAVVPHPEDSHPRHRVSSRLAITALQELAVEYQIEVKVLYYLAPWAGGYNTYFHSPTNTAKTTKPYPEFLRKIKTALAYLHLSAKPAKATKPSPEFLRKIETALAYKKGLAALTGELTGGFGSQSPTPEAMGGTVAERFKRERIIASESIPGPKAGKIPSRGADRGVVTQEEHEEIRIWLEINEARSEKNRRRDLEKGKVLLTDIYGIGKDASVAEIVKVEQLAEIYAVPGMQSVLGIKGHWAIRDGVIYVDKDVLAGKDGALYLQHEVDELMAIRYFAIRNGWSFEKLARWLDAYGPVDKVGKALLEIHEKATGLPEASQELIPDSVEASIDRPVRGNAGEEVKGDALSNDALADKPVSAAGKTPASFSGMAWPNPKEVPPEKRVVALISGGESAGVNAVFAGVAQEIAPHGYSVEILRFGLKGLVGEKEKFENSLIWLNQQISESIQRMPGAYAGTARVDIVDKKHPEYLANAVRNITEYCKTIMIIGGNDHMFQASLLAEALEKAGIEALVIATPKSVDYDAQGDYMIGADSAGEEANKMVIRAAPLPGEGKIVVFEMMGRSSGYLTAKAADMRENNGITYTEEEARKRAVIRPTVTAAVPEWSHDKTTGRTLISLSHIIEDVKRRYEKYGAVTLVASEGFTPEYTLDRKDIVLEKVMQANPYLKYKLDNLSKDEQGNPKVSELAIGEFIAAAIEIELGDIAEVVFENPAYSIRTIEPNENEMAVAKTTANLIGAVITEQDARRNAIENHGVRISVPRGTRDLLHAQAVISDLPDSKGVVDLTDGTLFTAEELQELNIHGMMESEAALPEIAREAISAKPKGMNISLAIRVSNAQAEAALDMNRFNVCAIVGEEADGAIGTIVSKDRSFISAADQYVQERTRQATIAVTSTGTSPADLSMIIEDANLIYERYGFGHLLISGNVRISKNDSLLGKLQEKNPALSGLINGAKRENGNLIFGGSIAELVAMALTETKGLTGVRRNVLGRSLSLLPGEKTPEIAGTSVGGSLDALFAGLLDRSSETRQRAVRDLKAQYPDLTEEVDAYFASLPISGKKILAKSKELGKPVLACNIDNGELSSTQIRAMMKAALEMDAYILFEVGPDALKTYAEGKPHLPEYCAREAYRLYKETGKIVTYAVHLDHNQIKAKDYYKGTDEDKQKALQAAIDRAKFALAQGFTSFATDTSTLTELEKGDVKERLANATKTGAMILQTIYEGAQELGIEVGNEGEVGDIGKEKSTVEEALAYYQELVEKLKALAAKFGKDFSKEPLIDIIALNIGTSHGYDFDEQDRLKPYTHGRIDLQRAREVHEAFKRMGLIMGVALHGFSGTPIEFAGEFINTGIAKVNINTDWQAITWKVLEAYYPELYKKMFMLARELAQKDAKKKALVTGNAEDDYKNARNRIVFGFARTIFRDKQYHPLLEEITRTLREGTKVLPVASQQREEDHVNIKLTLEEKAKPVTAYEAMELLTHDRIIKLMGELQLKGSARKITVDRTGELRLQAWQLRELRLATASRAFMGEQTKAGNGVRALLEKISCELGEGRPEEAQAAFGELSDKIGLRPAANALRGYLGGRKLSPQEEALLEVARVMTANAAPTPELVDVPETGSESSAHPSVNGEMSGKAVSDIERIATGIIGDLSVIRGMSRGNEEFERNLRFYTDARVVSFLNAPTPAGHEVRLIAQKVLKRVHQIMAEKGIDSGPLTSLETSQGSASASDAATILIAEDNPAMAAILSVKLKKAGFKVLLAPDGKRALAMAQSTTGIDLIISDVSMPHLTGGELAVKLYEAGNKTPIILMSTGMMPRELPQNVVGTYDKGGTSFLKGIIESARQVLESSASVTEATLGAENIPIEGSLLPETGRADADRASEALVAEAGSEAQAGEDAYELPYEAAGAVSDAAAVNMFESSEQPELFLASAEEHPLIQVISQYVVPLGSDKGPGVVKMSLSESADIYRAVDLLRNDRLEIILPKSVGISETMKSALRDANNRHRNEVRKKGEGEEEDIVTCRIYSDEANLKAMLEQPPAPGVKRIVITDKAPKDEAARESLLKLAENNTALFKDTRLLNILLPEDYNSLKEDDKTFHQARVMMIAILARLVEKDSDIAKIMLKAMLDGYVTDGNVDEFVENLAKDDSSWSVVDRIKYFLGKTVSLIPQLVKELDLLKLRMKTFWIAA